MKESMMKVFFEIHKDLPREGPGDSESTEKAFSMLSDLPEKPHILDVGCGPGMQTIDISNITKGKIVAIDNHQPYLKAIQQKLSDKSLSNRVMVMAGDMSCLGFKKNSFDLIWSEGAIYIMGFEKGLQTWKPFLKKNGYIAVSEITWLKSDSPEEIKNFWSENYPALKNVRENLEIIQKNGYSPIGHFTLPESAWWNDYYHPIEKKLDLLLPKYKDNDEAMGILEIEKKEIDLFRKYADYYGYVFYVMQIRS